MYKYRKENMQNKTTNSTPEMVREGVVVKFDFKPIKLFRILKGFLPCSMQNFESNTSCPTVKILQKKHILFWVSYTPAKMNGKLCRVQ